MSRDAWVIAFANEAVRLRPQMGLRHDGSVALSQSTDSLATDPVEAARMWIEKWKPTR